MRQLIDERHQDDINGNPAGGETTGMGIMIRWQNGPLGRGAERLEPNGAFVEGVIEAAIGRLAYYQSSRFRCKENAEALCYLRLALCHLSLALDSLDRRTRNRESRQVEGTHTA